jgi:Na+/melibiose symporter-like transporter
MLVLAYVLRGVPYGTLVFVGLAFMCLNFSRPVGIPVWGDVADYIGLETGRNRMSDIMTVFNLQFKIAGFVAMLGSSVIALSGFKTGVDPTPAVQANIIAMGLLVPAAFAITGSLIHTLFFRLDYKKLDQKRAAEEFNFSR